MQQSQWEILTLKPTPVFLSFIEAQLPDVDMPDLSLLQTDTTAYTISSHDDDEETLNEIEKQFPSMFHHEIQRWLGNDISAEIESSFLDFLCCFKFQMHSQIVLMEPSIKDAHQLICVKPRSVLLKWMKSSVESQSDLATVLERVNISHLSENATAVAKNFKTLSEVKPFIKDYYKPIFKAEMLRMCDQAEHWPDVASFEEFSRYFAIEVHTNLIHLH